MKIAETILHFLLAATVFYIIIELYKNYNERLLQLKKEDQKFLRKYITENNPNIYIRSCSKIAEDKKEFEVQKPKDEPEESSYELQQQEQSIEEESSDQEPVEEKAVEQESIDQEDVEEKSVDQETTQQEKVKIPAKEIKELAKRIVNKKSTKSKRAFELKLNYEKELLAEIEKLNKKK